MTEDNKIFKTNEFSIEVSPVENTTQAKNVQYFSYDENSGLQLIHILMDGKPIDLPSGTEIRLSAVKLNNQNQKLIYTPEIVDPLKGIVSFVIPREFLGYRGKIRCGLYINFSNNQTMHVGYFYINMGVSDIDTNLTEFTEDFWQGWSEFEAGSTAKMQELEQRIDEQTEILQAQLNQALAELNQLKSGMRWYNAYKMADGRFTSSLPNTNQFIGVNSMTPVSYNGSTVIIQRGVSVPEWGTDNAIQVTISGGTHASIAGTMPTGLKSMIAGSIEDFDISIYVKNVGNAAMSINPQTGNRLTVQPNEAKRLTWHIKNFISPSGSTKQFVFTRASQTDTVDIIIWHPKWANLDKTDGTTIFTTNPLEDLLNANPKQKGLGILNSESESDYIWQYSDDYIDYLFGLKADKTELNALADRVSILE